MSNLQELAALASKHVWDGVTARIVQGERITMAIVELEPDGVVPQHRHDNEQIGMVIQGSVAFTVGEEARQLGPGGTWRILGGVPHEVRVGGQGAVVVEVFSPTRSDWEHLPVGSGHEPHWPA
jgi:quercetin dioxygenase-like cupin family protein